MEGNLGSSGREFWRSAVWVVLALSIVILALLALTAPSAAPSSHIAVGQKAANDTNYCTRLWQNDDAATRDKILDRMQVAGMRYIRTNPEWSALEYARDLIDPVTRDWFTDCFAGIHARGMKVIAVIAATPTWSHPRDDNWRTPPDDPADFGDFCGWFAGWYRPYIDYIEVLNEQDSTDYFTGTIQQYVAMLQSCYNAVKAVAPEILVSVGGTQYTNMPWYQSFYNAGGQGYFDVAAVHPYANGQPPNAPCLPSPDGRGVGLECLRHLRNLMLSRGDDKPIIVTEFGWTTDVNPEPQQAEYAVDAYLHVRANFPYVPLMVWYKDASYPGDDAAEDGFGLLRSNLTPRLVYTALLGLE